MLVEKNMMLLSFGWSYTPQRRIGASPDCDSREAARRCTRARAHVGLGLIWLRAGGAAIGQVAGMKRAISAVADQPRHPGSR